MKPTRLLGLLMVAMSAISAVTQTRQMGIVLEYNGTSEKIPLAGVHLSVRDAANVVTDKEGRFTLTFDAQKPGDRIQFRRIEKLGYEVFNQEAVEQLAITPNAPIIIVLIKSSTMKELRDKYVKEACANYKRSIDKERKELEKLRNEGDITDEEYQSRLKEMSDKYKRRLDDLDEIANKFARIDLSELSAEEQEIITLVQEGKTDEAIERYQNSESPERDLRQSVEMQERREALEEYRLQSERERDEIMGALNKRVEVLFLTDTQESKDEIAKIIDTLYQNCKPGDDTEGTRKMLTMLYSWSNRLLGEDHPKTTAIKQSLEAISPTEQ